MGSFLSNGVVDVNDGIWSQGGKMTKSEDSSLVKEKHFVRYDQLIEKAEREGRLNGSYRCLVCGMRYNLKEEAEDCCKVVASRR